MPTLWCVAYLLNNVSFADEVTKEKTEIEAEITYTRTEITYTKTEIAKTKTKIETALSQPLGLEECYGQEEEPKKVLKRELEKQEEKLEKLEEKLKRRKRELENLLGEKLGRYGMHA